MSQHHTPYAAPAPHTTRPAKRRTTRRERHIATLLSRPSSDRRRDQRVLADYHADTTRRARARTVELVRAGYHIGPVPYGYRPRRVPLTPASPAGSRVGTRLVIEPIEAATVNMIFAWRVQDRLSIAEITRRLTASRYPLPMHPVTRQQMTWSTRHVRLVLGNPVYTGRSVWGRRRHGRSVAPQLWVLSSRREYVAVVTDHQFLTAQSGLGRRVALAMALGVEPDLRPESRPGTGPRTDSVGDGDIGSRT